MDPAGKDVHARLSFRSATLMLGTLGTHGKIRGNEGKCNCGCAAADVLRKHFTRT